MRIFKLHQFCLYNAEYTELLTKVVVTRAAR